MSLVDDLNRADKMKDVPWKNMDQSSVEGLLGSLKALARREPLENNGLRLRLQDSQRHLVLHP